MVVDPVADRLSRRYGFKRGEVQLLSPMHRGEAGVGALNALLQERLNPWSDAMPEARGGGRSYRTGDRVLQLRNDYAIPVHKAQGAEFRAVVLPLVTSHAPMLGRTLLYTAITCARRLLVIVGQKKALYLAVRDWWRAPRPTALRRLLDGTLRFDRRPSRGSGQPTEEAEPATWEGIGDGPAEP